MAKANEIKMRVNQDKISVCGNCGTKWGYTREMYDMKIFGEVHTICYECTDVVFHKVLTAQVKNQAKVKSKEDMVRIERSNQR